MFLRERTKKCSTDAEKINQARKYLNGSEFHKRLRNCFEAPSAKNLFSFPIKDFKTYKRNELTMITIPKPKFAETNVPIGQSNDDYRYKIIDIQTHVLNDAIDRVSFREIITDQNLT